MVEEDKEQEEQNSSKFIERINSPATLAFSAPSAKTNLECGLIR